jgi:hypothetical protein
VFVVTAIANFIVVGLALFVLRPLRASQLAAGRKIVGQAHPAE